MVLCCAPCPLLLRLRRPPVPTPCREDGRVGLWEFHWFKNTQRKQVRGREKGEGDGREASQR